MVVITILLSIGSPLLGSQVFLGADLLQHYPPWRTEGIQAWNIINPGVGDTVDGVFPKRAEFRRRLLSGDYPSWNTYPSGGQPLGTVPNGGLLSPLNTPYWLLPLWYAPAVSKLLEMATAVGFSFLFLRSIGLSRRASSVGGLIFVNSGFLVVWTNWPQSQVAALIPALFWATERAITCRRLAWSLPLALVLAVMLVQGFPSVTGYAILAVGAYGVTRLVSMRDSRVLNRISRLRPVLGGAILGIGLSSLVMLPFAARLDQVNFGARQFPPSLHIPFRGLATLMVPNAQGSYVDENYFGGMHYMELQSFLGGTAMVLILYTLVTAQPRIHTGVKTYLWVSGVLTGVLLFVGGPVLEAVQSVPIVGETLFLRNFVGRLRSVFGFLLACLAAIGFDSLFIRAQRRGRWQSGVGWLALAAVFGVLSWAAWQAWQRAVEVGQAEYVARQAILPLGVMVAAGAAVPLVRLLLARADGGSGKAMLVAGIFPLLIAAESLVFVHNFWPRVPRDLFYPVTSAHRFLSHHLAGDRIAAGNLALYPGTTSYYRLRSVTSHSFHAEAWKDLLVALHPGAFEASPTFSRLPSTVEVATSPILDRLGARYFVTAPWRGMFATRQSGEPAVSTVALAPSSPLSTRLPGVERLRGIELSLPEPFQPGSDVLVDVKVHVMDSAGGLLTSGSRALGPTDKARTLVVPVVEADLADERLTIRILLEGSPGDRLMLGADAGGRPNVSLMAAPDDDLRLVFVDGVLIYERENSLPRIRWASSREVVVDPAQRVDMLAGGVDADTVILSDSGPPGSGRPAALKVIEDSGDVVRVDVASQGNGYVVVADDMQHGWRAMVDGRETELQEADHAGVAVFVAQGEHRVTLFYDPPGWDVGRLISLGSAMVMVGILLGPYATRSLRRGHSGRPRHSR